MLILPRNSQSFMASSQLMNGGKENFLVHRERSGVEMRMREPETRSAVSSIILHTLLPKYEDPCAHRLVQVIVVSQWALRLRWTVELVGHTSAASVLALLTWCTLHEPGTDHLIPNSYEQGSILGRCSISRFEPCTVQIISIEKRHLLSWQCLMCHKACY